MSGFPFTKLELTVTSSCLQNTADWFNRKYLYTISIVNSVIFIQLLLSCLFLVAEISHRSTQCFINIKFINENQKVMLCNLQRGVVFVNNGL